MGAFNTPTPVYSAERPYDDIPSFNDFGGLREDFEDDTTMGLKSKELTLVNAKGVKNILKPNGDLAVTMTVIFADTKNKGDVNSAFAFYDSAMTRINTGMAENIVEEGATAVEDTDKRAWGMKFHIETATGDDCYFQIGNKKAVLSSYTLPSTLATINTWCNTQPLLDNDITA